MASSSTSWFDEQVAGSWSGRGLDIFPRSFSSRAASSAPATGLAVIFTTARNLKSFGTGGFSRFLATCGIRWRCLLLPFSADVETLNVPDPLLFVCEVCPTCTSWCLRVKSKNTKYAVAAAALIIAAFMLMRPPQGRETLAVKRILNEALAAKAKMPFEKDGGGLPHLEVYINDLKTLRLDGVPEDVRRTFLQYIAVLEHNAEVRRTGGNTNAAEAQWTEAEIAWGTSMWKYTTTPF